MRCMKQKWPPLTSVKYYWLRSLSCQGTTEHLFRLPTRYHLTKNSFEYVAALFWEALINDTQRDCFHSWEGKLRNKCSIFSWAQAADNSTPDQKVTSSNPYGRTHLDDVRFRFSAAFSVASSTSIVSIPESNSLEAWLAESLLTPPGEDEPVSGSPTSIVLWKKKESDAKLVTTTTVSNNR